MLMQTDKEVNDFIDKLMPEAIQELCDMTAEQKSTIFNKIKLLNKKEFEAYKKHFVK